jgi:cobalt-zinc-cadmium efflux system protein
MGHDHSHTPGHSHSAGSANKGRLKFVLALSCTYLVVEVVGGLLSGSLALLAEAAHMFTDVAALALALFAIRFAERPPTPQRPNARTAITGWRSLPPS